MTEHKDGNPEEAADGQNSLGSLFQEKEVEEIVATVKEDKPKEEIHNAAVAEKVQPEPKAEGKTPAVDA
ncbi:hypothetical protein HPP92_015913 [Vanilla planifolia]|uniref:Uncharacterized protein n=1 Tax=Vanilla planifolia TaxID=51239 RepID=A0A835URJ9_VANPL|nr:hypothetical protein HPP92_015913 [Vanilla planifolia]